MRFTVILVLILIPFSSFAQGVSAYIDHAFFKGNETTNVLEFYFGFDAENLTFKNTTIDKKQGAVFVSISLKNGEEIVYFDKFNVKSAEVEQSANTNFRFNFSKRILVPNVKTLSCNMVVKDAYFENDGTFGSDDKSNGNTLNFDVSHSFKDTVICFSDIQLLDNYQRSDEKSDFVKNGFLLNPMVSNFYPTETETLKYYVEIYNSNKSIGADEQFLIFTTFRGESGRLLNEVGKFSRHTSGETVAAIGEIDIAKLPSGNFFLILEVRNKKNELLGFTKKYIQRLNKNYEVSTDVLVYGKSFASEIPSRKIKYYMECLNPIASETEYQSIIALIAEGDSVRMQNYFFDFWFRRHRNEAKYYWEDYEKRIRYVDQYFGCGGKPGYKSEMGRIHMKYGAPNRIDDEFSDPTRTVGNNPNEYQIWYYYVIDNQRNRMFVFTRTNRGNCDFDMVHSNVNGEYQNHEWLNNQAWRNKMKQTNNNSFFRNPINEERYGSEF